MKKTVIKRRKRVPAAPGVSNPSGRMSDQAAAEALVSVARNAGLSPNASGAGEDSGEEDDQPKKKRTRRSTKVPKDKDHDVAMDEGDDDEPASSQPARKRRGGWDGDRNSPSGRRNGGLPAFPVTLPPGFELPSLAALNGAAFLGGAGAPSSYMRSGSNAPSRAHSPLNPNVPPPGYALPPGLQYYAPPSAPPPSEMSSLMVAAGVALGGLGIPSYMDLERHYFELAEQKRRWEEMMERTDRLMAGMKRTLDEMRGLAAQIPPHGLPVQQPQPQPAAMAPPLMAPPPTIGGTASKQPSPAPNGNGPAPAPAGIAAAVAALNAASAASTTGSVGNGPSGPVPAVSLPLRNSPGGAEREKASVWPIVDQSAPRE